MKTDSDRKYFYLLAGLGIINLLALLLVYPKLPQMIPVHWNLSGEIDATANKNILFLFAAIPVVIPMGMYLTKRIDPKSENYKHFSEIYLGFCAALSLFFILTCWLVVFAAFGFFSFNAPTVIPRIICLCLGLLLIVYGNLSPRIKQNHFFGIKTPWTLESEKNWQKTQRLGGLLMIILGLLFILSGIFFNTALIVLTVLFLFGIFGAVFLYSYLLSKES